MRTTPALWAVLSLSAVNVVNGGELKSLEGEAISFLGEILSAQYTGLVSALGDVLASDVPPSAKISDLPALVSEIKPQLTAYESELAALAKAELSAIAAPSAIRTAVPALATDAIEDAVSILANYITAAFPASMALTAIPAALATEEPQVLSAVTQIGEELFSELAPEITPISKALDSWLPGAISTLEAAGSSSSYAIVVTSAANGSYTAPSASGSSFVVATSTGAAPSTSVAVQTSGADGARSVGFGLAGVVGLLAFVVAL